MRHNEEPAPQRKIPHASTKTRCSQKKLKIKEKKRNNYKKIKIKTSCWCPLYGGHCARLWKVDGRTLDSQSRGRGSQQRTVVGKSLLSSASSLPSPLPFLSVLLPSSRLSSLSFQPLSWLSGRESGAADGERAPLCLPLHSPHPAPYSGVGLSRATQSPRILRPPLF